MSHAHTVVGDERTPGPEEAEPEPTPADAGGQDGEDQSPSALWAHGANEGQRRLHRRPLSAAATGLVGGVDVMIGVAVSAVLAGALAIVMPAKLAAVLGSLVFGVGFVLITIGRSELFSENFLIPVGSVLERREPARLLPRLWLPTLATNVVGMLVLALIFSSSTVLDHNSVVAAGHTADVFADRSTGAAFLSAVAAGLVMTLWTWLVIATRTDIGRIVIALVIGSQSRHRT